MAPSIDLFLQGGALVDGSDKVPRAIIVLGDGGGVVLEVEIAGGEDVADGDVGARAEGPPGLEIEAAVVATGGAPRPGNVVLALAGLDVGKAPNLLLQGVVGGLAMGRGQARVGGDLEGVAGSAVSAASRFPSRARGAYWQSELWATQSAEKSSMAFSFACLFWRETAVALATKARTIENFILAAVLYDPRDAGALTMRKT